MESLAAYIPIDRRQALAMGEILPDQATGAAFFADLSGFTLLTEALVQALGPEPGAEALTNRLNKIYDTLIPEVHRYRGSVIGFSGDAITGWFDADHGERAIACALSMQRALTQFSQIQIPAGPIISLAIKVAIAVGPVHRFRVGDPQIQYLDVLAGATLDRMAAAEKLAAKGEVMVSPEVVEALASQLEIAEWRHHAQTGQRFAVVRRLRSQVAESPWQPLPPLAEAQIRPWLLRPVYERLQTGQGRFLAETRRAVALFLRFGGLDYDYDEQAGLKLDAYIRLVQNVLAYYDGYLIQLTTGDKGSYLYAAFGAPLAHDDPARAVMAALELRALASRLKSENPEFGIDPVQIGISQGRMWAGAYGSQARRTYGVLGNETNIAARLMGRAEAGQILVSQRIVEAARKRYRFEELAPIQIKGKQDALPVAIVLGEQQLSPQRPATIFIDPPLGRDPELAQMEDILESVLAGQGQILRIDGAAGIGKSRLAAALVERAKMRNLEVAQGTCQSTTQDIPYYPWRQIFRTLLGLTEISSTQAGRDRIVARHLARLEAWVDQTNPDWRPFLPLLGDLLDLPIPISAQMSLSPFERDSRGGLLIALLGEMMQAWGQAQPLLLLVEDMQWMDEASQGLSRALAQMIENIPILLVLTHRPIPPSEPEQSLPVLLSSLTRLSYYHHLTLGELSSAGVMALVANRLGGQPSALALALIQARADNNPFFVEELVDALRRAGHLDRQDDKSWTLSEPLLEKLRQAKCLVQETPGGPWQLIPDAPLAMIDLGMPDSIHGLVLSRLDRLPEAHKLTLKVASVIGRTFEFDLLDQAHPDQPDRANLSVQLKALEMEDLIDLEMWLPWQVYAFKQHLTQEVVYNTLTEQQQRELHRAVAHRLEKLMPGAVERLAYHYTQAGDEKKAFDYLLRAGDKARSLEADRQASDYYQRASLLLPALPGEDLAAAQGRYRASTQAFEQHRAASGGTEPLHQAATDNQILKPTVGPPTLASFQNARLVSNRYILQEKLGQGGMGEVWLATDIRLKRPVALKYLGHNYDLRRQELFVKEANTLANLDHPHIATIHDIVFDEAQGYYLVMEYVPGVTLAQLIQERGQLDLDLTLDIALTILRALQYAHQHWGIVHRDIKPANIIMTDQIKILDFGLASLMSELQAGSAYRAGTPGYMAPEQIQGGQTDARADLYALGATLFEMLTGRLPFENAENLLEAPLHQTPPSLMELLPAAPPNLEQVLAKLLAPDPKDRYASATEVLAALSAIQAQRRPQSQAQARPVAAARPLAILPWVWLGGGAIVLLALALFVAYVMIVQQRGPVIGSEETLAAFNEPGQATPAATPVEPAGEFIPNIPTAMPRPTITPPSLSNPTQAGGAPQLIPSARLGQGVINTISLSPDGVTLAVAGSLGVWLYELETLQRQQLLAGQGSALRSVVWSPDQERLAAGSDDGSIFIWEAGSGQEQHRLAGHPGAVTNLAWSPDGSQLASVGGSDRTVRVWDVATDQTLQVLSGHLAEVEAVAWSADGKQLASASSDRIGAVRLWDAATGREVGQLDGRLDSAGPLAWSPDGLQLASIDSAGALQVWDISGNQEPRQFETLLAGDTVSSLAWSPDGRQLALAGEAGIIQVWDIVNGAHMRRLEGQPQPINSLAWTPDQTQLISASRAGALQVWDVTNGQTLKMAADHSGALRSIAWSPAGGELVAAGLDGVLHVWDVAGQQETRLSVAESQPVLSLAWSPAGAAFASGSYDGKVQIWDVATGQVGQLLQGHTDQISSVAWSPDGTKLASASLGADGSVRVWDAGSGRELQLIAGSIRGVNQIAWSPDSAQLILGSNDRILQLWNLESGQAVKIMERREVLSVAWSPDGAQVVSGNADGVLRLWDAVTGAELGALEGHTGPVLSVAWSPDGARLASAGGSDRTVRIWDVAAGQELAQLIGHTAGVWSVAWSPDGSQLASVGDDGVVYLWEMAAQ